MSGFGPLVRKELLEQWRTSRLAVVAVVFALIGLGSPLLALFTPEILKAAGGNQFQIVLPTPTAADAVDQLLKNTGQFGGLIAVLLAMGSVATEKERGTAALLLATSASRAAYLVAKLVAIGTTLAIGVAVAAAGAWFYTLVLFEQLPVPGFAAAALLVWLSLLAYASITFLGSVLTRSAIAAAGLGVAAFIVLGIVSIVPEIGRYLPTGLGAPARALALGLPADVAGPMVVTIAIVVALVVLGWVAFRRQEL